MSTPKPQGGGVSKMVSTITDIYENKGYNVFYTAFEKLDDNYSEKISYFPSLNPLDPQNREFLVRLIKEKGISIVINQIPLNVSCSDLLYSVKDNTQIKIVSIIHNASLNIFSNIAYRYEFDWKDNWKKVLFYILRQNAVKKIVEYVYVMKHRKHYRNMEKNSDSIILVSESNREDVERILGYNSNKIKDIPNSIFLPPSKVFKKKKTIVWCGLVDTIIKRADMMVDIWCSISDKYPDWTLYILGYDEDDIVQRYAKSKNAQNIVFTGNTNPIPYYKEASIFCHTSVSESFGLTIAEAMSYGAVPVVFDGYPASKDVVPDGCGFRIKGFDRRSFAKKLSKLMEDESLISSIRIKSQEMVTRYSVDKISTKWIDLIEELK